MANLENLSYAKTSYHPTGRELRLVITNRCNYDCPMCHHEGIFQRKDELLNASDYGFLVGVAKNNFGFSFTTLTGGEPLRREDVVDIAQQIHLAGVGMTVVTNASKLMDQLDIGKYVSRINVSLHSMQSTAYDRIVGRPGKLYSVIEALFAYRENFPDAEIRLNATVTRGDNDSVADLLSLISFSRRINSSLKLLELYDCDKAKKVGLAEIKAMLLGIGFHRKEFGVMKETVTDGDVDIVLSRCFCSYAEMHDKPGEICHDNNDIFVSPDAKLKPCRMLETSTSILGEIKSRDEDSLVEKIKSSFDELGKLCPLKKART